jgi:AcrR family transcriptional regulator
VARTPSASAHEKVLEAAIRLIGERGIESTSMDAIAAESGVSKATVYKHWKDKEALCIDVICRMRALPPEFHSGDPRCDMIALLRHVAQANKPDRLMKIWPRIIGYAIANPKFAQALQSHSFGPRRQQIARILKEAVDRGELPDGIDADFAMDLLVGPIMHRKLTRGDAPQGLPEQIVDAFWRSFRKTSSGATP